MRLSLVVSVGVAALALVGCGAGSDERGSAGSDETGDLKVLAAASLTETFATLADAFERRHPGVDVQLAFDSSATLAEQVRQGAPADVLATADEASMQTVVDADGVEGEPRVFATNHLVLVVPVGNPAGIRAFPDLARPGVKYVVCVDSAPCGKLATEVLEANHVVADAASEEVDVKAVLAKVELDEADAGLVYASDVAAAGGRIEQVDVPTSGDDLTAYPIAALADAEKPGLAREWVELVLSEQGRRVMSAAGFGSP